MPKTLASYSRETAMNNTGAVQSPGIARQFSPTAVAIIIVSLRFVWRLKHPEDT